MKEDAIVSDAMKKAGDDMASILFDASISQSLKGLGGGKLLPEIMNNPNIKNKDLVTSYLNGKIDSITAIYIAMHRES